MAIDEQEFFREATVRICSSLDIETALGRFLRYLEKFIPVSKMYLNIYEPTLGVLRNVATVTRDGSEKPFPPTPMPKEAIARIESGFTSWQEVRIAHHLESEPVPRALFQLWGKPDLSALVMLLVIEGERIGSLVLLAEERNTYTQSHADLFSLLREPITIAMSNAIRFKEVLKLKDMLDAENRELTKELRNLSGDEIIGADFGLRGVMEMVRQVAPLDSPVVLLGETGVGKEVIASAIHYSSPRHEGPFVKVNCGAIPDNLLDSELFGHEKGSFTGAISQKRGRFERAQKGSIFLDEIGDLPPPAQVRLLRVLQSKEIERVGGTSPITVDVRIIAATHRNLEEMIDSGQFREDLWFRLNTFPIIIPPLRQRKEDIPALLHHFIEKKSMELKIPSVPPLSHEWIEQLKEYHWPGNVRELENLVERALIQSRGQKGSAPMSLGQFVYPESRLQKQAVSGTSETVFQTLDEAVTSHIKRGLSRTNGKIYGPDGAAQLLGVNPNTLRSKMRKLGIPLKVK